MQFQSEKGYQLCSKSQGEELALCDFLYTRKVFDPSCDLKLAIDLGIDIDKPCMVVGRTPLMICAQKGWTDCLSVLLVAGADARAVDESGRDALMLALISRQVDSARILSKHCILQSCDADGRCALALAFIHAPHKLDLDLAEKLWEPDLESLEDKDAMTPVHWALAKQASCLRGFLCMLHSLSERESLVKFVKAPVFYQSRSLSI